MGRAAIRTINKYVIIPETNPAAPDQIHLTTWDIAMLSAHYIQNGLLFAFPKELSFAQVIEQIKEALEEALFHFYPLSGRLRLVRCEGGRVSFHIEVGKGAELVHAKAEGITVSDIVADGEDLPNFLKEFFHFDLVANVEGCYNPLLAVQVTEIEDGFFLACAFNHVIGDGTSFWNFFNAWAEICRSKTACKKVTLSKPPVHDRLFIEGCVGPPIKLPYSTLEQFITNFKPGPLRERMFHFSAESLEKLKARANKECGKGNATEIFVDSCVQLRTISTFQALSALIWRSITRARRVPPGQETSCRLAIQNRSRIQPSQSSEYFGNSLNVISATTTACELLTRSLGWVAYLANQAVNNHTDCAIREYVHKHMEKPKIYNLNMFDKYSIMIASSPRFDMFGCDFGWGKALAARSGSAHKYDGKVSAYQGWEMNGSIDLEVCLLPEYMSVLENDEELMAVLSPPVKLEVLLETQGQ